MQVSVNEKSQVHEEAGRRRANACVSVWRGKALGDSAGASAAPVETAKPPAAAGTVAMALEQPRK